VGKVVSQVLLEVLLAHKNNAFFKKKNPCTSSQLLASFITTIIIWGDFFAT